MGKMIVCIAFALFACGLLVHFVPGSSSVLFHLGPVAISGTMLMFIGGLMGAYKLTGK